MATLALMAAGSWLGSTLFGSATLLGMSAAAIGGTIGAIAGSLVDNALFARSTSVSGAKADLSLTTSTEGAVIPRLYGRQRMAGQIVWATKYRETTTSETTGGGKGGPSVTTTTYSYSISIAVGLCEGPISRVERIWADGNDLDLSNVTWRVHTGTETQEPDPLIEEIEGAGNTPAYRGLAYVVFEDLALEDFGNRIPQLQFEVVRAIGAEYPDTLESLARAVTIIPGSGRFVYGTTEVKRTENGETLTENRVNPTTETDFVYSLDQLQAVLPNVSATALVVSWFGTDLRCGACSVLPGIDTDSIAFDGGWASFFGSGSTTWSVAGYDVATAHRISSDGEGRAWYGATPSDGSVAEAIAELKRRGRSVLFYPFVMMDVPPSNTLPDPYSDDGAGIGQSAFPWRGRITCHPAPGRVGTVDGSATAAAQVATFFAAYREMVLHYAELCRDAGGVDGFLIGSELVGLTTVRDDAGAYPAVTALKALAADVRAILGATVKIGYAADWSEYHSHRPADGSGDVIFALDDLWADANIDFVGIDTYLPLTDWRDGEDHLDWSPFRSITDRDYLQAGIEGGEYFDWYYASEADREVQARTPITDGAYGEPWVFRNKDMRSWWGSAHHDRPGGVRSATATAWVPMSKPIWFTEFGCPAIDKGPNQPNVFVDAKSSESAAPWFSNGWRDDLVQRRMLEAVLAHWADEDRNPISAVYGGRMIDTGRIFLWTWDARPFPWFPASDTWSDGDNWRLGHWLNGRAGLAPAELVVKDIGARQGFAALDVSELRGLVPGYLVDQLSSARAAIEPLGQIFFFDGVESEGVIAFRRRDRPPIVDGLAIAGARSTDVVAPGAAGWLLGLPDHALFGAATSALALDDDHLVVADGVTQAWEMTRAQETDLPLTVRLQYTEAAADYRSANAYGRRRSAASVRETVLSVPFVLEQADAIGIAESTLIEAHVGRETAKFALPPSALALEPCDVVGVRFGDRAWTFRLGAIADAAARTVEAVATEQSIHQVQPGPARPYGAASGSTSASAKSTYGRPLLAFLDLPLLTGAEAEVGPVLAAYARPWKGVVVYRSTGVAGFALDTTLDRAAVMGETTAILARGPTNVWDEANTLSIRLYGSGAVASADALAVLAGANVLALETEEGVWEIVQFRSATLTGANTWDLTGLLRGQAGTETAMRDAVAAGARVVVLDGACARSERTVDEIGLTYNWRWGPIGGTLSSSDFDQIARPVAAVGLRPYAPAHVAGKRDAATGDVTFSWVRRTRKNGDGWDLAEVPLSETVEAYELDILDGTAVKRTLAASSPSVVWTAAEQAADFGAPPASVAIAVHQISSIVGRGSPRAATLTL